MSHGPMPFKVTSVKRAVRAAQSVGLDVRRVKIGKDGCIELDVGKPATDAHQNPWDEVLSREPD
ncbi:MAG: hypothetical protein ACXWVR_07230 [Rhodoplanes sp.]